MSRINTTPNKPQFGVSGSGRGKSRVITIVAGAALFGTVVGGASAVGVVMAIVQPPAQPQQAQAAPTLDKSVTTTASAQNPQPAPSATPSTTWPDALSARTDRGAAAPATPTPEVATAASDPNGSRQMDELAAQDRDAPASEPTVAERAPWPNPISPSAKAKRRAVVMSEPAPSAPPATSAAPTPPAQPQPCVATDDTNTTPANKTRDDSRNSRLTQQQQPPRSRDAMDQASDDREPAGYPPRQRVIVVAPPPPPPPERDAGVERDRWDHGNGLFGLFDFGGHDRWNDDHGSNDRWHDGWHD